MSWPRITQKQDIYTNTKYGKKLSQEVRTYIDNMINTIIPKDDKIPEPKDDDAIWQEQIGPIKWSYSVVGLMKKADGSEFEYPIELSLPPEYVDAVKQYIKNTVRGIDSEFVWPTEIIKVKCMGGGV